MTQRPHYPKLSISCPGFALQSAQITSQTAPGMIRGSCTIAHAFISRLVIPIIVACAPALSAGPAIAEPQAGLEAVTITSATGQTLAFEVEIADTRRRQVKGLSFRTTLEKNRGMLFVFEKAAERRFWMRNTFLSLDIIFINETGRIINIHRRAVPERDDIIASGGPAKAVLEINGGLCEELGINPGDRVRLNGLAL